jgi:hypothetical protein
VTKAFVGTAAKRRSEEKSWITIVRDRFMDLSSMRLGLDWSMKQSADDSSKTAQEERE